MGLEATKSAFALWCQETAQKTPSLSPYDVTFGAFQAGAEFASAEARREELEEVVKIFDGQRPEWVTKMQGEYWDGYRDAIEDAIDDIRDVPTTARARHAAALSELAAQDAELIGGDGEEGGE